MHVRCQNVGALGRSLEAAYRLKVSVVPARRHGFLSAASGVAEEPEPHTRAGTAQSGRERKHDRSRLRLLALVAVRAVNGYGETGGSGPDDARVERDGVEAVSNSCSG
jgi:hypothetical protein